MEKESGITFNQTCAGVLIVGLLILILFFSGLGSLLRGLITPASPTPNPVPSQSTNSEAAPADSPTFPTLNADQRQSLIQDVSRNIRIRTNPDNSNQPFSFVLEVQTGVPIRSIAMNEDESLLATGLENGLIMVWSLSNLNNNGEVAVQILAEHAGAVTSLDFDWLNVQRLASASADGTVRLWDVATSHVIHTLVGHKDKVNAVAFIPNNPILASASADSTIKLWESNSGQELVTLEEHSGAILSLDIDTSAAHMISGGEDNQIVVWDLAKQQPIVNLAGHTDWVSSLTYIPSTEKIASVSYDKTVRIWTISPPQAAQLVLEPSPNSALMSITAHPSGNLLALADSESNVYLWNIPTSVELSLPDQTLTALTAVKFSPRGTFLAAASATGALRLWHIRSNLIN